MKKLIIIILTVLTIFLVYKKVNAEEVIIPDNSIRLRVIPNSNSSYDQAMKSVVKDYLEKDVYNLFKDTKTIEDAREIINNNLDNINYNIQDVFDRYNYDMTFNVNYGNNYFPEKVFKGVKYNEGYYESIVVSIGEAKGDNWWCVLFPNLCIVNDKDVEYTSLVKEIIDKIFK